MSTTPSFPRRRGFQQRSWSSSVFARLGDVAQINPRRPLIERDDDALTSFVPMEAVSDIHGAVTKFESKPFASLKKGYTYFEDGDVIWLCNLLSVKPLRWFVRVAGVTT